MRQEKIQIGNDIAAMLTSSDFVYFVSYKGLSTAEMNNFRDKLYAAGANCHVLKNRVVRKVAELNGLEALANTIDIIKKKINPVPALIDVIVFPSESFLGKINLVTSLFAE